LVDLLPSRWLLPGSLQGIVHFLGTLAYLAPVVGYTVLVGWWGQSIGRSLMQLRVVNRFGLTASNSTMVTRTTLRMLPLWLAALMPLAGSTGILALPLSIGLFLVASFWLLIDAGLMLVWGKGTSLHDRLAGTRVVWDTK
jgi:uncharacterized RDD family membrane protein YckC